MLPTGCICFRVYFFFVPSNGKYLKIFSRPKHEILLISLLAILLDNKIWKYSFHYSNKHKFPFLIYIKWKCKIFAIGLLRSQAPLTKKNRELKRKLTPYLLTPKCNIVGWRCYRSFLYTIIHIFSCYCLTRCQQIITIFCYLVSQQYQRLQNLYSNSSYREFWIL